MKPYAAHNERIARGARNSEYLAVRLLKRHRGNRGDTSVVLREALPQEHVLGFLLESNWLNDGRRYCRSSDGDNCDSVSRHWSNRVNRDGSREQLRSIEVASLEHRSAFSDGETSFPPAQRNSEWSQFE